MNILSAVKGQTHVLQKAKKVELQNAYFKGANPKIGKKHGEEGFHELTISSMSCVPFKPKTF